MMDPACRRMAMTPASDSQTSASGCVTCTLTAISSRWTAAHLAARASRFAFRIVSADRPLRVLIVDDEPLSLRGLRLRLERMTDIEIISECTSGRDAVEAIERDAPDLVLLDIQMPE